jgi:hypothetical protein
MKIEPEIRVSGTELWVTLLILICALLLVWIKTEYPKKIPLLFREVFTGEIPVKEKGITLPSIFLFFIYLFCITMLIIRIIPFFFNFKIVNEGGEFIILFSIIFIYYIAKTLLLLFSGFIFEQQAGAWEYISEIYIFTHLLGILLLPLTAVMVYAYGINHKLFGEIVLASAGLLLVYRTIKMFILMTSKGLRTMYLILYICSLEIVPLALFIKYGLISHLK